LHEAGFPLMAAGLPQVGSCSGFIERYFALSEKLCALAGINSRYTVRSLQQQQQQPQSFTVSLASDLM
jgi:hypothetical protein